MVGGEGGTGTDIDTGQCVSHSVSQLTSRCCCCRCVAAAITKPALMNLYANRSLDVPML